MLIKKKKDFSLFADVINVGDVIGTLYMYANKQDISIIIKIITIKKKI